MENFKFTLSSILIIGLLCVAGYWAFSTIESGSSHVDNQKLKELENKNKNLEKELIDLKKEISLLEADKEEAKIAEEKVEQEVLADKIVEPTTPEVVVSKYQTLINELQKLASGKIYLQNKSQGPAVGTVQKFLNIYNNTSAKVDNDYGTSTGTAIKAFQKAQGLTVDGETGPNTYLKMISWLKSH
jgi:murein L,D-transpeptidase YcbB/YkuD